MIKVIDKRTGQTYSGDIVSHHHTFSTHDELNLPYLSQHWWHEIELDTGFTVIISDDDVKTLLKERE